MKWASQGKRDEADPEWKEICPNWLYYISAIKSDKKRARDGNQTQLYLKVINLAPRN